MKKLLLIISAILSLVTLQAQVSDGYLTDGDIVSISVEIQENELNRYYLEASADGILTQSYATANCLWELGISENNGAYHYTLKDLTSDKYMYIDANPSNPKYSLQNTATTFTLDREAGEQGKYETGKLYYRFYYSSWNSWQTVYFAQGGWWPFRFALSTGNIVTVQIEKWNKEGADTPGGGFYPETLIFPYASDNNEAQAQQQDVTFTIPETAVVSYQCINRPDEIIGGGQNDVYEGDITDFHLYWESSNTKTSEIKLSNYYSPNPSDGYVLPAEGTDVLTLEEGATAGTKQHTFTITPVGKSPMNLRTNTNNRIQWVNYADRVVAEYKYKGNTVKQTMRVVRNSYHEEPLPPLTFHVNPTMFTFGADEETVNITVVPIHQHGSVIYDVNQNVFKTEYEPHDPAYPERLSLTSPTDGWVITTDDGADWLSHTVNDNSITITAEALGSGQSDRTATFTGTFKRENAGVGHNHQESFTIQLAQRSDAGIQFVKKNQEVHTATRTIYYLPEDKIELRLAESNFFGYMRWYDYHTGKAPNYNFGNSDPTYGNYNYATSWYTTPRGANNQPFTPINTPASADTEGAEGRSWGLYAINHHHGGILNEGTENSNNTPVLNGWNYNYTKGSTYSTEQSKRAAGYHTIACDVSAYTDYVITTDGGVVKSITEPTLSYRQLFDLRPAGEMADKLAALNDDEYLEEYHYQAPAGKNILLTPQFKYRKGNDEYLSKLCYFYWNGNNLVRVTNATWTGDGQIADNGEYLTVSGNAGQTKIYTLTANDGAVRIAKFTVTFTDPQTTGPSRTLLKSDYEMTNIYSRKAHINFNYTDDSKKTTLTDGFTYYNQPLNATESTYGFVYTQGELAQTTSNTHHGFVRAASQGVFPFYGEYVLVNGVSKSWGDAGVSAENHGGKDKGFALYVDGTTEPGLVVSISAEANICSGQTMYCSAWLCNPSNTAHQGSNPIFRFNVQGRKEGQTEWEDAGVFFVGELPKGSGWQQVVFPIESAHSYDETRVSLYNFATSGAANDFLVDDISLFVSQLPIAAYQGKMACRSTDAEHSSAAAVLRLDYSNIQAGSDGYMYYQIYNTNLEEAVNLTGEEAYYHDYDVDHGDDNHDHPYGSVHIPATNYNPEANGETFYYSVSAFLDDLITNKQKHGKAYVKTTNDGVTKWLLYVAHIVDNVTKEDMNGKTEEEQKTLQLSKLYDAHEYTMRMAYSPLELPQAECNMQTPLHATQQTVFELRNSDSEKIKHELKEGTSELVANQGEVTNIYTNSVENCANDLYFLTAKVVNHLAVKTGLTAENVEAPIYADWLVCPAELDAIFENDENEQKDKEEAFYKYYGFRPGEVASAVMYDMRRKDNNTKNYNATSFNELDPSQFLNRENYNIVKHLHDNGWLQFRKTTIHFYLPSAMVASYWCFPIEGTAKTTIKDENEVPTEVTLKDCNEPRRIRVTSASSNHMLNIAPMTNANKTSIQKTQIPLVKVLANQLNNVEIPITESANIRGVGSGKITINLENMGTDASFYNLETREPSYTASLSPGTEHTIRLVMRNLDGNTRINGKENECRVGYVFATIQILPNTLVWTPTESSFNGWGKDENWKGWVDRDKDNVIDKTNDPTTNELCEGYVPISGADVIIPKLDNTLLYPYIVPEHTHNHYPMTVGFQPHHCKNIYFAPGAHIYNQHLLEYTKAFVDMQFPAAKWHLVSAPLQGMVSGDMFVPHNGWWSSSSNNRIDEPNPFEVGGFQGIRSGDAAYAFWEAFYNTNVDGSNTLLRNFDNLQFTQSNTLVQPLTEGTGYAVYGLGWKDTELLTVRLPKPDERYAYYADGKEDGTFTPELKGNRGKLAYTATHDAQKMAIQLTNKTASEYFLFGNPTMAFVDMHALYLDNKTQWNGEFKTMTSNIINATTPATMTTENRYLPPMTSALLKVSNTATEMTINLLPSHLTLNNMINPAEASNDDQAGSQPQTAPARRIANMDERPVNYEALQSELMTIYAFTPKGTARTVLATNPAANDYYTSGEDALFTSTGVENESYVTTPLNMYTVAEQVPMMADVRQGISQIPLGILAAGKARSEYMQVAFYLTQNWSRECYFCDAKTGQRIRIMDGLVISVEMPLNHEQRYYIEGPDTYRGSEGTTTSTTQPSVSNTNNKVWAYAPDRNNVVVSSTDLIKNATLYDLSGRLVASSTNKLVTNSLTLHTACTPGVYIVDVTLRDGSIEQAQVIVH